MHKLLSILLCLIVSTSCCFGGHENEMSLKKLKKLSEQTGKKILLDFYFIGCGACVEVDKEVFSDPKHKQRVLDSFFIYHYNIYKEKGKLEEKYDLSAYPSFVIIDQNEKPYRKFVGYKSPQTFFKDLFNENNLATLEAYEEKFPNYKSDTLHLRGLIELHLENTDTKYEVPKSEAFFEVYELFFKKLKSRDSLFLTALETQLFYEKKYRVWFEENLGELKNQYALTRISDLYKRTIRIKEANRFVKKKRREHRIVLDSLFSFYRRFAVKLTELYDEDKRFEDSIYLAECYSYCSFFKGVDAYHLLTNRFVYGLLDYTINDETLSEEIYQEILSRAISFKCKKELVELVRAIDPKNEERILKPEVMEVLAIAYYRLGYVEEAIQWISKANTEAIKQKKRFKTIVSNLKKRGLLQEAEHKCD